jgi:hypothetical protein
MEEHAPKRHMVEGDWAMFSNIVSHSRFNIINVFWRAMFNLIQHERENPLMSFENHEENDYMHDLGLVVMSR